MSTRMKGPIEPKPEKPAAAPKIGETKPTYNRIGNLGQFAHPPAKKAKKK